MSTEGPARASALSRRTTVAVALVRDAVQHLRARGGQASVSAVGIAMGIGTVVLLLAIVTGLRRYSVEHIASAGGNVIQVSAQPDPALNGPTSLPAALRAGDELVVLAASPYFDLASAENRVVTTIAWGNERRQSTEVRGITAEGLRILRLRPRLGRTFLQEELQYGSRVAVIGAQVARHVFGSSSPLGQTVHLGTWDFVVVGVLNWAADPARGVRSGLDEAVYVPYRTGASAFRGDDRAAFIRLRLRDPETGSTAAAEAEAVAILDRTRQRRGETGGGLQIANTVEQMRTYRRVVTALQVLIAVVGGLGLFVGGVGIAHALLISARERTTEFAVRRVLGATRRSVFTGILLDSLLITIPGGLVGLLAAFCLTRVSILLPFVPVSARPHFSLSVTLAAMLLVVVVGLSAGVAAARSASRVAPASALRAALAE